MIDIAPSQLPSPFCGCILAGVDQVDVPVRQSPVSWRVHHMSELLTSEYMNVSPLIVLISGWSFAIAPKPFQFPLFNNVL